MQLSRKMKVKERVLAALVGLVVWLGACEPTISSPVVPSGTLIEYRFAFDWEGAEVERDTRIVETNLGYRIGIDRLYVAVGAVELVPCGQDAALEASWMSAFAPARALADHGWVSDATRLEPRLVENALGDDSWLGPVEASGTAYCELFWTLTPVEASAADGFELVRTSVLFEGWWEGPDGERTTLTADLRVGRGAIIPVSPSWSPERSDVQVTRYPARALDDISFSEETAEDALTAFALRLLEQSDAAFVLPP